MKINLTILKGAKSLLKNTFKPTNASFGVPMCATYGCLGLAVKAMCDNDKIAEKERMLNAVTALAATAGGLRFGLGGAIIAGGGMYLLSENCKQYLA